MNKIFHVPILFWQQILHWGSLKTKQHDGAATPIRHVCTWKIGVKPNTQKSAWQVAPTLAASRTKSHLWPYSKCALPSMCFLDSAERRILRVSSSGDPSGGWVHNTRVNFLVTRPNEAFLWITVSGNRVRFASKICCSAMDQHLGSRNNFPPFFVRD